MMLSGMVEETSIQSDILKPVFRGHWKDTENVAL